MVVWNRRNVTISFVVSVELDFIRDTGDCRMWCIYLLLQAFIASQRHTFIPPFLSLILPSPPPFLSSFLPLRDLLSVNLLCKPITQGRIVNIQVVWTLNDSKNNNTLSPDVAVDESVWKKEWEKGDKYEDLTREDKNVEYEAILLSR